MDLFDLRNTIGVNNWKKYNVIICLTRIKRYKLNLPNYSALHNSKCFVKTKCHINTNTPLMGHRIFLYETLKIKNANIDF